MPDVAARIAGDAATFVLDEFEDWILYSLAPLVRGIGWQAAADLHSVDLAPWQAEAIREALPMIFALQDAMARDATARR